MTIPDKIHVLRGMVGNDDSDEILTAYLALAGEAVLARCYPYDKTKDEIPNKYSMKQIEIAAYLLNKRGAEGQLSHSENGISRSYESGDVPESMLKGIVPFCGVVN